MTDIELVTAAIDAATDGNVSAFARLMGYSEASRVFSWRAGTRPLPLDVRVWCAVIVAHPEVALWLAEVAEQAE